MIPDKCVADPESISDAEAVLASLAGVFFQAASDGPKSLRGVRRARSRLSRLDTGSCSIRFPQSCSWRTWIKELAKLT